MSSEHLASAKNHLKGDLGGSWNILDGASAQYTDLGIARRFGGSAAAYSLRDIGAMNGRVVKVRREQDDAVQDFSAGAIASGGVEQFAIGQDVLDLYNNAAYTSSDSNSFTNTPVIFSGAFTLSCKFVATESFTNTTTRLWQQANAQNFMSFSAANKFRYKINNQSITEVTLDSSLELNRLYTVVITRSASDVISISIDGVTQSNTGTLRASGDFQSDTFIHRMRGVLRDVNFNDVFAYTGDGADASNWTDTIGSNDCTKNGSPVAFTGQGINAFVDTWYDQSGNGNNLTQPSTSLQPKIIREGSLVATGINFNGTSHYLESTSTLGVTDTFGSFIVHKPDNSDDTAILFDGRDSVNDGFRIMQRGEGAGNYRLHINSTNINSADGSVSTSETLLTSIQSSTAATLFKNSVSQATDSNSAISVTSTFRIAANNVTLGTYFDGTINEIVMFASDKTSDRTDIENDINNHYSIY
jgi:hypothetical protein